MAGAAPAYSYRPERARTAPRPDVRVVPGTRPRTASQTLPQAVIFLAKTIAVVLVVLTMLGFVRIALSSAAVSTSLAAQEVASDISAARSAGSALEVQQSTLANPTRVKTAAAALGMAAPAATETIVLDEDVVATDGEGNLSFAESVRRAAGSAQQG